MAAEMVNTATSEKLKEMDWSKNIEICELVVRDQGQAKYVVKQLKKRLGNKNANVQLFSVTLLETLVNNCGEYVHKEVIDNGLLPVLVKIVKKKTNLPVRERIFLLLDATQTALGGTSGKFPQYYSAYYELVSAGVEFTRRPHIPPPEQIPSKEKPKNVLVEETLAKKFEDVSKQTNAQPVPDSSIIHKASSVMEILEDVLNALDPKRSEGATDEFVLDLVEQCSFQKQRVMHLVMTSGDERLVTQAIELNERLHKVLTQHDALLSVRVISNTTSCATEGAEEEDAERLYRRMRKGKACAVDQSESPVGSFRSISEEQMRRPLIRPLCIQPSEPDSKPPPVLSIPPPPAKHVERERFFKEKHMDGTGLDGHMRGLSLDSRNGSSSRSGSTDFSERDVFGLRD